MPLEFMMVLNHPEVASYAAQNGVDILFLDLEKNGKHDRQGHLNTWITDHTLDDVKAVRRAAPTATVLVRINPVGTTTSDEITAAIDAGADILMLPMFTRMDEIETFYTLLDGRCRAMPLVETHAALDLIPQIIADLPVTDLHIGLNDLHLDMGLDFMFEPFSNGLLEAPTQALQKAGISFGIGGIARASEGIVSPEFLLGEHVRLGSERVILSRSFHRNAETLTELHANMDFPTEVAALHHIYNEFTAADPSLLDKNHIATADRINDVVRLIRKQHH